MPACFRALEIRTDHEPQRGLDGGNRFEAPVHQPVIAAGTLS
jgi:hypothetical protein